MDYDLFYDLFEDYILIFLSLFGLIAQLGIPIGTMFFISILGIFQTHFQRF